VPIPKGVEPLRPTVGPTALAAAPAAAPACHARPSPARAC